MINSKEKTNTLTNDELYNLYLNSKLQKSLDDIKNGRVMTLEESIERMRKTYEDFHI